jgi:hypothetical protein
MEVRQLGDVPLRCSALADLLSTGAGSKLLGRVAKLSVGRLLRRIPLNGATKT